MGEIICKTNSQNNDSDIQFFDDSIDDHSFTEMFSHFYHQLKDPSEFSFFKITEYEAQQTAVDLQQYINSASAEEKEKLKEYELSIYVVESYRSQPKLDKPLSADQKQRYLYDIKQIDWNIINKVGLSKEKLEKAGAMESLLKGYNAPMLLPIAFSLGSTTSHMEARLSLVPNIIGTLEIRFHPIRKDYDFSKPFYGHHFTKEDQSNLIQNGNMGRVVDLIHPITEKKILL